MSGWRGFFHLRLRDRVRYERFDYWDEVAQQISGQGDGRADRRISAISSCWPARHAMHGYQINLVHHTQRFLAGDALMTFVRERCGRRDHSQAFRGARGAEGAAHRRYGRRALRSECQAQRGGMRPVFRRARRDHQRPRADGGDVGSAGDSSVHRARDGRRAIIASRSRTRFRFSAAAMPPPICGEHAALRQGDRRDGAALSRAVSMDASALPHPPARHGAGLRQARTRV